MHNTADHEALPPPLGDDKLLWDAVTATYFLPVLAAADEVGLFTLLAAQPLTTQDITTRLNIAANPVQAMLGMLVTLGFLKQQDDQFHLTDVTRSYLLPDSRYYWGAMLRLIREPAITFGGVMQCLRSGKPITQHEEQDMWDTHGVDAERARLFTQAMHSHSMGPATGVARQGDFSGVQRLLDIGGASACFSIELARRHLQLQCTILDLPMICELARDYAQAAGMAGRISTVAADMFKDTWPAGHDAVFFSNIFHDWDAQRCQQLADKSFAYLPAGGRIYLHEILLNNDQCSPLTPASYSMDMALYTGGKQYSARELTGMLTRAGFNRVEFMPTHGYFSLVTGFKT